MAFQAPDVEVGMLVNWYPSGDTNSPHAAIVTKLGIKGETINVSLIQPDNYNLNCRDGVRHVKDPRSRVAELRENGTWDFTQRDKVINRVLEELLKKA